MDRLSKMETSAYSSNLTGIYDNASIANNTDKSYLNEIENFIAQTHIDW